MNRGAVRLGNHGCVCSGVCCIKNPVAQSCTVVARHCRGPTVRLVITHRGSVPCRPRTHHEDRLSSRDSTRPPACLHVELEVRRESRLVAADADLGGSERQSWCILCVSCSTAKKDYA